MSLLVPFMPWNAADHGAILDALKKRDRGAVKRGIVHDIRTTKRALLTVLGENGMADCRSPHEPNCSAIFRVRT